MENFVQKNNRFSLEKVLLLCVIFSCIVFIDDITAKYFLDKCEQVTIVLHSVRVIIDLLFFYCFGLSFKAMFKAKKTDICIMIVCFFLGLSIMCLGSCIQSTMMLLFPINETTDESSKGFLIFLAVYVVLIAPIFEEIEYRMLLFVGILKKTNKLILAILVSSIMFLIIHSGSINYGAFILAIISTIIYYNTGNIKYSIMMHFSGNSIGAIFILLSLNSTDVEVNEEIIAQNEVVFNIVVNLIFASFWVILLLCMLAIVFYRIKKKLPNQKINLNEIKMNDNKGCVSVGLMIIYFVICIADWILLGWR